MKQAIFEGAYNFVVKNVPKPEVQPGSVLVRVKGCSICGSDVHLYHWDMMPEDPNAASIVSWGSKVFGFPVHFIMGHQFCGEVVETGPEVENCGVGDRVVCRGAGAYAEYALSASVYPMPEDMTYEQGTFVEPLSVAVDAIGRSGLKLGDIAVIQGAGTIGLLTLQAVKAAGAQRVIVTEISDIRLEKARSFGADEVINASKTDVVGKINELTCGFGPGFVFDCTGNPQANQTMLDMLPVGGTAVVMSSYEHPCELDMNVVMLKSLNVLGILSGNPGTYTPRWDPFQIAIDLMKSGKVSVDPLITAVVPLEEINEAFDALAKGKEMAVVVRP